MRTHWAWSNNSKFIAFWEKYVAPSIINVFHSILKIHQEKNYTSKTDRIKINL